MRVQDRNGSSDAIGGGGGIFRVNRSTNFAFRVGGGANNVSLAERRRDDGGQALPRALRTGLQLPLSLVHRRQGQLVTHQSWRGTPASDGDWPRATPIPGRRSRPPAEPPAITPCWFATRFADGAGWTRPPRTRTASKASKTSPPIGSRNLGGNTLAASVRLRMATLTTLAADLGTPVAVGRYDARPADRVARAEVSMTELLGAFARLAPHHGLGGGRDRTSRWPLPSSSSGQSSASSRRWTAASCGGTARSCSVRSRETTRRAMSSCTLPRDIGLRSPGW